MSEMERYEDRTPLTASPAIMALRGLLAALPEVAERVDSLEQQQAMDRNRVNALEIRAAESRDWLTLLGFVKRYNVQPLDRDNRTLSFVGGKLANWCKLRDIPVRNTFSEMFGSVNRYPASALYMYFNERGYRFNRDLYNTDRSV